MDSHGQTIVTELIGNLDKSLTSFDEILDYMAMNNDIENMAPISVHRANVEYVRDIFKNALNKHKASKMN